MDIQRLYSTVAFMLDEDRRLAIQQTLEQLSNFLVNLQNQPGNQQLQGQAVQFRDQLTQGMRQFQERVTPVQRARIIDLSQDYFSLTFSESIEYEMQRNAMAPAVIAAKVKDLSTKRKELLNRLDSLRSTMDYFHIPESDLQPGDADIAFLIPRALFDGHLEELAQELQIGRAHV